MSWLLFVQEYRIPYKKGASGRNIQIMCPFCGPARDTSWHLGLNTGSDESKRNEAYGCWEDKRHSGKDPVRLIRKLLNVSKEQAEAIAQRYFKHIRIASSEERKDVEYKYVEKPKEFLPFTFDEPLETPFLAYLKKRGFDSKFVINRYNLHWCVSDRVVGDKKYPYSYRLIIPVMFSGEWYSWTARSIDPNANVRYLAASEKEAPLKPSTFFYDQENLTGGKLLVITEAPFNAMKITSAFIPGVDATGLFGKIMTKTQSRFLRQIAKRYDKVAVSLDQDAIKNWLSMFSAISCLIDNLTPLRCPSSEDWAAMSVQEIREVILPVCSNIQSSLLTK